MKKFTSVLAIVAVALMAGLAIAGPMPDLMQQASFPLDGVELLGIGLATLAADKARNFELGDLQELPMIGSDIIYEGAAVGDNGSGLARPLVAADPFLGFAERTADNSAGAASALRVRVRTRGQVQLAVTGAASAADVGETVYASDDDTFTLTAGSNTAIGKVSRWVSGTTCIVAFEAAYLRSL